MRMDIERFENILIETRKTNKKKTGNRAHKFTCVCGFYTGRRYNYDRHQSTCTKILQSVDQTPNAYSAAVGIYPYASPSKNPFSKV